MATVQGGFGTLRMEVEELDVTSSLPQSDKKWTYTDQQGHPHYWRDGYPTLVDEPVGEPYFDEDLDEEYQPTRLVCAICREPIKPGTRYMLGREYMPGRRHYFLNDEPISEERFNELRAARG